MPSITENDDQPIHLAVDKNLIRLIVKYRESKKLWMAAPPGSLLFRKTQNHILDFEAGIAFWVVTKFGIEEQKRLSRGEKN